MYPETVPSQVVDYQLRECLAEVLKGTPRNISKALYRERPSMSSWEVLIYPKADGEPLMNFKERVHFRVMTPVWKIY